MWLLTLTIRHQPTAAVALVELTVYRVDGPEGLVELPVVCPAVKRVSVWTARKSQDNLKALKTSWEPLFDVLEQQNLVSFDWHGPDGGINGRTPAGKGVTRALRWHGLEELQVSEEFSSLLDPILVPPTVALPPSPSPFLTSFSLERSSVPDNLLDLLHPLLPSLPSLSLHTIHRLSTADFSRALLLLSVSSLSLLGSSTSLRASNKLTLSSLALSLSSLSSLTLSGTSAPLDLFETLPRTVRHLSLDPREELEPA